MSMPKAALFVLPLFLSAVAYAQQPARQQGAAIAPLAVRWVTLAGPVEHAFTIDTTPPSRFVEDSGAIHNSTSATAPAGSNWHPLQQVPPGP